VIEAACGKLDTMEANLYKQQTIITNLQSQVENMKNEQVESTVLLEEILFAVSQSKNADVVVDEKAILENLVQTKPKHDVN